MVVQRRRIRQIVLKREDVDSTAETLAAADVLGIAIFEPTVEYDVPEFERKPAQATLSNLASLTGAKSATLSFGTDLKGGGALNTEPGIGPLIEASGFLKLRRTLLTIGAVTSGPFKLGEVVTGGTSNAEGILLRDINAAGAIELHVRKGTFANAEVLTGATSGATATTSSAEGAAGFAYMPHSRTTKVITIGAVTGGPFQSGEEITAPSGAVGRVVHDIETGRTQLYFMHDNTTDFANGELITGGRSGATATTASIPGCANPTSTYTVESREDGVIKKIKGCRAKFTATIGRVGEPGRVNFELTGSPIDPIDGNLFPDVNDGLIPATFVSATFLMGSFTPKINSFEVEVDNTLSPRSDATDASGFTGALISDRSIKGTTDPEMTTVADKDWNGERFNNTETKFQCRFGSTPGNIIDIHANRIKSSNVSDDDRDGIAIAGIEFMFIKDTFGDDEIVLMFL